jgi:hypothetical protein
MIVYSEWRETGFRLPAQLYPQSRCYTYDAHCPGMQGLFPYFEIMTCTDLFYIVF